MIDAPLGRAASLAFLLLLAGCSGVGAGNSDERGSVAILEVDAPLREPTWVSHEGVLLALDADEPRVVRINPEAGVPAGEAPGEGAVAADARLEGVGENLAPYLRKPERVYVPQPEPGRVAVLNATDLRVEETLRIGDVPPFEADTQQGSDALFTLSRDGATVTAFDLERGEVVDEVGVEAGEGAMLEAPEKGLHPSFWVANRGGVSFYHGDPAPIRRVTGERIGVEDIAVDHESAQRAYVAEAGSGRVVALEGDPEGLLEGELLEVAERDLGEAVEHVEAEETEVYAVTRDTLFVMRREDLSVRETVNFRGPVRDEALKSAPVSGMTVGKERVYLTLEGEPYVLGVDKP